MEPRIYMSQGKVFYTFVVAPSAKGRFYRFNFRYSYLYGAVASLLGVVIALSIASIWVVSHAADIAAFSKLKKENLEMNNQLLAGQSRIEKLSARVNNIEDQAKKII